MRFIFPILKFTRWACLLFITSFSIYRCHTFTFIFLPGKYSNCTVSSQTHFETNCTETVSVCWHLKSLPKMWNCQAVKINYSVNTLSSSVASYMPKYCDNILISTPWTHPRDEMEKVCNEGVSPWDVIIFLLLSNYLHAITGSNARLGTWKQNSFNNNAHYSAYQNLITQ